MISAALEPTVVAFTASGSAHVSLTFRYAEEYTMRVDPTKEMCRRYSEEAVAEFIERQITALNRYLADNGVALGFDDVTDLDVYLEDVKVY